MRESIEAQALSGASRDVLETMFFTEVLGEKAGMESPGGEPGLEARLKFEGQRSGEFRLKIAPGAARSVAGNFLGAEDEAGMPDSQISDTICELANMVCGSALSRLAADLAFELSHPELVAAEAPANGWTETAARTFELENGWLIAAIRFEGT